VHIKFIGLESVIKVVAALHGLVVYLTFDWTYSLVGETHSLISKNKNYICE